MNMTVKGFEISTYLQNDLHNSPCQVCIVMTFLLPYNVRCDALHLNCSIMISWNLFFALHKIHTTHRIPGDFSRLRLKVEKFLFASFCTHKVSLHTICINIKVSFSVYTSRCDSNLNLTLMSDACWRYFLAYFPAILISPQTA